MLLFLYGKETLLARRKLQEIIARYTGMHKNPVHLRRLDCSNIEQATLQNELQTHSLFRDRKLLILEHVFVSDLAVSFFLGKKRYLENSTDVIVFFEEQEPQKSHPLFRFLQKNAKAQEFSLLKGSALSRWILQEFRAYRVQIKPEAMAFLEEHVGSDLWRLSQEIQKVATFAKSRDSFVTRSDLDTLVARNPEIPIFRFLDAVAKKNKPLALAELCRFLAKGESPLYLLSMLFWQFRNLLIVKDSPILQKSGLHPYVFRKCAEYSKLFTLQELQNMYKDLFQLDLLSKQGKRDLGESLYLFLARL